MATFVPPPTAYAPAAAYPAKKSNTLLKVVVGVVAVLLVGGALALGGLYYAAVKINAKARAVKAQILAGNPPSTAGGLAGMLSSAAGNSAAASDDSPGGFTGDPCRFLSKADVSQAISMPIIRTQAENGGCSYIAKGDPADVTSKHMASMIGGLGADAKTQKTIQKFAGGMFAQQEATDKDLKAEAATGEVPVLVVSFTTGNAQMEMKMNRGAWEKIKGSAPMGSRNATAANSATGDLTGIGDEAYLAGGSMIMVRKGNTVAHFIYTSCPCNSDNIKPLAQKVANQL